MNDSVPSPDSPLEGAPPVRHLGRKIALSLLLGALIFGGLLAMADWRAVLAAFRRLDPWSLAQALLLVLVSYALRFGRWHWYLRRLDLRAPLGVSGAVFLSGFVMTATPGKLGEVFKSWLLRRRLGVPLTRSLPAIVAERFTDVTALMLLAASGVYAHDMGRGVMAVFVALVLAVPVVLARDELRRWLVGLVSRSPRFAPQARRFEALYEGTAVLLRPVPALAATLLGAVGWSFECAALLVVLSGLGAPVSLAMAIFVYAFSTLVGALSFMPGGLFATEAGLALLLIKFGVGAAEAAAATILIRLLTLWFAVFLGAVASMAFWRSLSRRSGLEEPALGVVSSGG